MATEFTKISRSINEIRKFLDYYLDEYKGAYVDIRIKKGWRIEHFEEEIYEIIDGLWNYLYIDIYQKLDNENPATDQQVFKSLIGAHKYLKSVEPVFGQIIEKSEDKDFSLAESIVYDLVSQAIYKLEEVISLAEDDLSDNSDKEVIGNKEFTIGIVTATIREKQSILKLLEDCEKDNSDSTDPNIYEVGYFQKGAKRIKVVHTKTLDQGMQAASNTATKVILKYQPNMMFMIGHQAGNLKLKNSQKLGHIIVGSESVDYQEVEIIQRDSDSFNVEEVDKKLRIHIEPELCQKLEEFGLKQEILNKIKGQSQHESKFTDELKCHVGKIISGSALMRAPKRFQKVIESNKGAVGLDMETHGFYYACKNTKTKELSPIFASIKSISDFGENKPKYTEETKLPMVRQEFACSTSSLFLYEFLFEYYCE